MWAGPRAETVRGCPKPQRYGGVLRASEKQVQRKLMLATANKVVGNCKQNCLPLETKLFATVNKVVGNCKQKCLQRKKVQI
jgi:hypothetical protein